MTIIDAIILGIVQGATEFIPISSSGHLIIFRDILNIQTEIPLAFDAILHLATSFAVLFYFRSTICSLITSIFKLLSGKEVEKKEKTMLYGILVGTIPVIVIGLLFKDYIETFFRNTVWVAIMLVVGSLFILHAENIHKKFSGKDLTTQKGFYIGLFQVLALLPGMSRSGITISGGMLNGLNREDATKFSFLLAFPVVFGVGILGIFEVSTIGVDITAILVGGVFAFITGFLAIYGLIKFVKNNSLNVFVWYRLVLALLIILLI